MNRKIRDLSLSSNIKICQRVRRGLTNTLIPKEITPNVIDVKPKNHNPYIIDGVEVWALSEKRATEKFNKRKLSL